MVTEKVRRAMICGWRKRERENENGCVSEQELETTGISGSVQSNEGGDRGRGRPRRSGRRVGRMCVSSGWRGFRLQIEAMACILQEQVDHHRVE